MVMALVVGCAGDISAPEPNPDPPEADGGDAAQQEELPQQQLAPGAWQSMDLAARKRFMSEVVMPTMRPLFVDSDPERFATFSCSSCHGQGAADRAFAMPSADLPSLGGPAADSDEHKQRMTDFMRNTVKPRMAELLGDAELRCSNCHPSAS
jgi:hypothetical protein